MAEGWAVRWAGGLASGRTDEREDEQTGEYLMDVKRRKNGRTDGWTGEGKNERTKRVTGNRAAMRMYTDE